MNPSTALARVFVDEMARCGVCEAVLAPGSRSAPLAMALHAERRIRLHVRIDERSAAYLALGLAKASGWPVPVLCTSGTAAANLHPAVLEAAHGGVPLVVLTADRPPELRGTGANQTTDQIGLYGAAVRLFVEVGVPEPAPGMVAYWRSLVGRALARAAGAGGVGGPVHLNVALREPLVPGDGGPSDRVRGDGVDDGEPAWPEPLDGRPDDRPWVRVQAPAPVGTSLAELLGVRRVPERGAVVAGSGAVDPPAVVALAEAAGWPLLAEPTSNARCGGNAVATYPLLLADERFARGHRPEVVVTVGKPGLSPALLGWLATADRHIVVDPAGRWADPTRTADLVVPAVPVVAPAGIAAPSGVVAGVAAAYLQSWRRADATASAVVDPLLAADPLTEPGLARQLAALLPAGALLVVGSSRPVRDLDLALRPRCGLRVLGNRGLSGIDGTVSTAVGAALAHQRDGGGPAAALLGDLALVHDANGLVLGADEPVPDLTVVVVNNDGGGIFSSLPQATYRDSYERLFGTPHGTDLALLAAAHGRAHTVVRTAAELRRALGPAGLRVVEVRTERAAAEQLQRRLVRKVRAALAGASTL